VDDATGSGGLGGGLLTRLYPGNNDVALLSLVVLFLIGLVVIAATRARLGVAARPAPGFEGGIASAGSAPAS
jgi:hypothetical protein